MFWTPLSAKQTQSKDTIQYVLDTALHKQTQSKDTIQYVLDTTIRKQTEIT